MSPLRSNNVSSVDKDASQQRAGCGCCQHCRCTGKCVDQDNHNSSTAPAVTTSSVAPARANTIRSDLSEQTIEQGGDHYSALENARHPGDKISLPFKMARNYQELKSKDSDVKHSIAKNDSQASFANSISISDRLQEEYEAAYLKKSAKKPQHHSKEGVNLHRKHSGKQKQAKEEDEIHKVTPKSRAHQNDRKIHKEEKNAEQLVAEWRNKIQHEESQSSDTEEEVTLPARLSERRKDPNDTAEKSRKLKDRPKKSSHGKEVAAEDHQIDHGISKRQRKGQVANTADSVPSSPELQKPTDDAITTIALNNDTEKSERLESAAIIKENSHGRPHHNRVRSKLEILKEIKQLMKEAALAPNISPPNTKPVKNIEALYSTTTAVTNIPRVIEKVEEVGKSTQAKILSVIHKLSVSTSVDYALTLLFQDTTKHNERGELLVAFRLQDAENGILDKKDRSIFAFKKQSHDWLQESHEIGTKVKGKLSLAIGVKGPSLYQIDVKRRKVDKFVISSTDEDEHFSTKAHGGSHNDYHHLYFETPDGTSMKWELIEDEHLMRLYGRGEKDYGVIYAEARMQHSKHRGKEARLIFFDPNNSAQPRSKSSLSKGAIDNDLDYGFLCASWWCARQTFDESRLVAAHDEVKFNENLEDAFEIDLLALA